MPTVCVLWVATQLERLLYMAITDLSLRIHKYYHSVTQALPTWLTPRRRPQSPEASSLSPTALHNLQTQCETHWPELNCAFNRCKSTKVRNDILGFPKESLYRVSGAYRRNKDSSGPVEYHLRLLGGALYLHGSLNLSECLYPTDLWVHPTAPCRTPDISDRFSCVLL